MDVPIQMKQYPILFAWQDQVKGELKKMIDLGIVEDTGSPCSAPVVFLKNKTIWDFMIREFQKVIVFDPRSMPRKDESELFCYRL